jgi:hypothetical protein
MRRFMLALCAYACGTSPPVAPSHRHTGGQLNVPVVVGWRLFGDARYSVGAGAGALALELCGAHQASAIQRTVSVPAGAWRLRAQYANSDCTDAAELRVTRDGHVIASVRFASAYGTAHVDFELQFAGDVELAVGARGGASCCGTTELYEVELVQ